MIKKKYVNEFPLFLSLINILVLPSPENIAQIHAILIVVILSISLAIMIINKSDQPPIVKYNPIFCILILLLLPAFIPIELSSEYFSVVPYYLAVFLNISLTFLYWKRSND